jgi:Uma2 family endonuclease
MTALLCGTTTAACWNFRRSGDKRTSLQVLRALGNALGDRPCRVHTSDLRVYVEATGLATFPDGSVICGKLEKHAVSPRATAINPMVLLEMTSDSSEEYDTNTKLESYQTIPTLRDYLIVSHRERRVTLHYRGSDGAWATRVAIQGSKLTISSLSFELLVDDVYRRSDVR